MSLKDAHFVAAAGTAGTQVGTPVADYDDSATISDIVCMSKYHTAYFCLQLGARDGTTAVPVLTIIPCDDATPSATTTAIPFEYKLVAAPDTNVGWVRASTYTVVTGDDQAIIVRVSAQDLPLVSGIKYEYCYMNITEPQNDPQVGAMLIIMEDPRFGEDTTDTVTS